jgi:diguanylate cyclase (GGDEF)-like protein
MTEPERARTREDDDTTEFAIQGAAATAPRVRDRLSLMVLGGPQRGAILTIDQNDVVLGRGEAATLRFDDSGASRAHARIFQRDRKWMLEDLGSRNGTWVAGRSVDVPTELREGDRIQIGNGVLLKVTLQDPIEHEATRRIYESAMRDQLTRSYNRRFADERLAAEVSFAHRHGTPLSLLLLDVDEFKRVNDTLGHPAGDAVLRVLGAALQRTVRTEDVVARWGGEEFVVIARGIDARNAYIFAERIRKTIAALSIPWETRPLRVTVSVGVATMDAVSGIVSQAALLEAADKALYRAKAGGRNRVSS